MSHNPYLFNPIIITVWVSVYCSYAIHRFILQRPEQYRFKGQSVKPHSKQRLRADLHINKLCPLARCFSFMEYGILFSSSYTNRIPHAHTAHIDRDTHRHIHKLNFVQKNGMKLSLLHVPAFTILPSLKLLIHHSLFSLVRHVPASLLVY